MAVGFWVGIVIILLVIDVVEDIKFKIPNYPYKQQKDKSDYLRGGKL